MEELENWVSLPEAAERSGYSDAAVRRLCKLEHITAKKVSGRAWLIYLPSLLEYKAEMDAAGTSRHDPRRNPTWERSPEAGRKPTQD
jgi:hypothetical protein